MILHKTDLIITTSVLVCAPFYMLFAHFIRHDETGDAGQSVMQQPANVTELSQALPAVPVTVISEASLKKYAGDGGSPIDDRQESIQTNPAIKQLPTRDTNAANDNSLIAGIDEPAPTLQALAKVSRAASASSVSSKSLDATRGGRTQVGSEVPNYSISNLASVLDELIATGEVLIATSDSDETNRSLVAYLDSPQETPVLLLDRGNKLSREGLSKFEFGRCTRLPPELLLRLHLHKPTALPGDARDWETSLYASRALDEIILAAQTRFSEEEKLALSSLSLTEGDLVRTPAGWQYQIVKGFKLSAQVASSATNSTTSAK